MCGNVAILDRFLSWLTVHDSPIYKTRYNDIRLKIYLRKQQMLKGQKVTLRSMTRDDLPRLCQFNNDVEVELSGGGDPPLPQTLARLEAEFDQDLGRGG